MKELHVLRTQKEYIIKKYNELKLNFNACKAENSKLKKEAKINSAQLIAITSSWNSVNINQTKNIFIPIYFVPFCSLMNLLVKNFKNYLSHQLLRVKN